MNSKLPFYKKRWFQVALLIIAPLVLLAVFFSFIELTAKWELERLKKTDAELGEITTKPELKRWILKHSGSSEAEAKWKALVQILSEKHHRPGSVNVVFHFEDGEPKFTPADLNLAIAEYKTEIQAAIPLLYHHPRTSTYLVNRIMESDFDFGITLNESVGQCDLTYLFMCMAEDHMRKGEPEKAVEYWELCFAVERELIQTPILIHEVLIQNALQVSVFKPVEYWTSKGKLSSKALKSLQENIQTYSCKNRLEIVLQWDRLMMDNFRPDQLDIEEHLSRPTWFPNNDRLWRWKHMSLEVDNLADSWKETIEATKRKKAGNLSSDSFIDNTLSPSKSIFAGIGWVEPVAKTLAVYESRRRTFKAFLALARYKIENGNPPQSIQQLVPKYLDAIPLDPYTDKPLHYKRIPNGFKVWSVGSNEKDDRGAISADPGKKTELDVGYGWPAS